MPDDAAARWNEYRSQETARLLPILNELGVTLEKRQPHVLGERYLMQAVTTESGKKLILIGRRAAKPERVVVKATSDARGMREIEYERRCRRALQKIPFAYQAFLSPPEVAFVKKRGMLVFVQAFLESRPFLDRPTEEQFALALKAFKAQEGTHATAYSHYRFIRKSFGEKRGADYLSGFEQFGSLIRAGLPDAAALHTDLAASAREMRDELRVVEQYCGFLTHTDFVPHNFRVVGGDIYLLDHASIRFGNKYEGWARFVNFMELYNPALAQALVQYVRDNRTPEESHCLRLMRLYRLGEIIFYYMNTLDKSEGDLRALNSARVDFWSAVLRAVLQRRAVPADVLDDYKRIRDTLRSADEKRRQEGLH